MVVGAEVEVERFIESGQSKTEGVAMAENRRV